MMWPSRVGRLLALPLVGVVAACGHTADISYSNPGRGSAPVLVGPGITPNRTPLDEALACYGMAIRRSGKPQIGIAVGEIRDFTGRINVSEGAEVTQGGGLMVYSALGKLGGAVRIHERLDSRIGEIELAYMDRRQLGEGRAKPLPEGVAPATQPWLPYYGGSIARSDYYIVGGITELNHALATGGAELYLSGAGLKARVMVVNVAVDLRIVNTRSLTVERTVTLQKQVVGREVGANIFNFFGNTLVDGNAGNKNLEPMQLALRSVLEMATMELVDRLVDVDHRPCLPNSLRDPAKPDGSDPAGLKRAAEKLGAEPYAIGRAPVRFAPPLSLPARAEDVSNAVVRPVVSATPDRARAKAGAASGAAPARTGPRSTVPSRPVASRPASSPPRSAPAAAAARPVSPAAPAKREAAAKAAASPSGSSR